MSLITNTVGRLLCGHVGNFMSLKRLKHFWQPAAMSTPAINMRETPFIIAAKHRSSPQTLSVLLKAGADINAQDKFGNTAFIYIVKHPQAMMRLRVLDFMIDNSADPNIKNKHGKTVWDYASEQDGLTDYLCVRLLEEKSDE